MFHGVFLLNGIFVRSKVLKGGVMEIVLMKGLDGKSSM
jgi:hypothetical protein